MAQTASRNYSPSIYSIAEFQPPAVPPPLPDYRVSPRTHLARSATTSNVQDESDEEDDKYNRSKARRKESLLDLLDSEPPWNSSSNSTPTLIASSPRLTTKKRKGLFSMLRRNGSSSSSSSPVSLLSLSAQQEQSFRGTTKSSSFIRRSPSLSSRSAESADLNDPFVKSSGASTKRMTASSGSIRDIYDRDARVFPSALSPGLLRRTPTNDTVLDSRKKVVAAKIIGYSRAYEEDERETIEVDWNGGRLIEEPITKESKKGQSLVRGNSGNRISTISYSTPFAPKDGNVGRSKKVEISATSTSKRVTPPASVTTSRDRGSTDSTSLPSPPLTGDSNRSSIRSSATFIKPRNSYQPRSNERTLSNNVAPELVPFPQPRSYTPAYDSEMFPPIISNSPERRRSSLSIPEHLANEIDPNPIRAFSPRGSLTGSGQDVTRFPQYIDGVLVDTHSKLEEEEARKFPQIIVSSERSIPSSTGISPMRFIERPTVVEINAHSRSGSISQPMDDKPVTNMQGQRSFSKWELLATKQLPTNRRPSTESTLSLIDTSRRKDWGGNRRPSSESFMSVDTEEITPNLKRRSLLLAVQKNEVKRKSQEISTAALAGEFESIEKSSSINDSSKREGTRRYSSNDRGPHKSWRYAGGKRPAFVSSELRILPSPIIEQSSPTSPAGPLSARVLQTTSLPTTPIKSITTRPTTPTKSPAREQATLEAKRSSMIVSARAKSQSTPPPSITIVASSPIQESRSTLLSPRSTSAAPVPAFSSSSSSAIAPSALGRRRAVSMNIDTLSSPPLHPFITSTQQGPTKITAGDLRFDRMARRISSVNSSASSSNSSSSPTREVGLGIMPVDRVGEEKENLLAAYKELRSVMLSGALLPIDENLFTSENGGGENQKKEQQLAAILPTLKTLQDQMRLAAGLIDRIIRAE